MQFCCLTFHISVLPRVDPSKDSMETPFWHKVLSQTTEKFSNAYFI